MPKNNPWTTTVKETVTPTKKALVNLSIKVRTDQYRVFEELMKPKRDDKILDVGVASDEILKDSNMFEKLYSYPENITAATIEDEEKLQQLYSKIKVVKINPNRKLPFKNKEFDIVVSWATLEHVGGYNRQKGFINELLRTGRKVFITTPYRGALYEPHTGFFFFHWLPLSLFRKICKRTGKIFWSKASSLTPLFVRDIKRMSLIRKVDVEIYNTFKFLPTHIIITSK